MGDLDGLCELRGFAKEGTGCTRIDGLKHCAKRSSPRYGRARDCTTIDITTVVEPVLSGGTPPVFSVQPSVSPGNSPAGTLFTATAGTDNGTSRTRSWLLNGSALSSGLTATPGVAGTLTYQEFATNASGTTPSNLITRTITAAGNYLATVSSAPLGVYGTRRLVSGYSGNLFQLRRVSDNATLNVACASGSDKPDYAAIDTWRAGSNTFVAQMYDQAGSAPALVQATAASQFVFDTTHTARYPGAGVPVANNSSLSPFLIASPMTLDRQNISYVLMGECEASALQCGLMSIETAGTNSQAFYNSSNGGRLAVSEGSAVLPSVSAYARSNPGVVGMTANASERRFFYRETNEAIAAGTAGTASDFRVGLTSAASGGTNWKVWGWAIYPALSTGDMTTLIASAAAAISAPTAFDRRVVIAGDSIGHGRNATTYYRNAAYYYVPNLNGTAEFINRSVDGSTMATLDTNYAGATSQENVSRFFTSAYGAGKCALIVQRCTNDISAGTTASATYTLASSIVTKAKATGFKVGLSTMVSRGGAMDSTKQAERVTYNSTVNSNGAGADFVVDFAADSIMGDPNGYSNSTYFGDVSVHPNDAGYARLAPYYTAAINTALGA